MQRSRVVSSVVSRKCLLGVSNSHYHTSHISKKAFSSNMSSTWSIAVHGGAGDITDVSSIPLRKEKFAAIVDQGVHMLKTGGNAIDVVEEVVRLLEDCKYFNAGRGSVMTNAARFEMDAIIADGSTGAVGAVSSVSGVRNPVELARVVQEDTQHVLISGEGASELAKQHNVPMVEDSFFFTQERFQQLQKARKSGAVMLDHGGVHCTTQTASLKAVQAGVSTPKSSCAAVTDARHNGLSAMAGIVCEDKFGTVGCVAMDVNGHLAAAGSTGGLCNKMAGRVGDTPVYGAGLFADSSTCAIACTGHGETFLRNCVAHDIHARMSYLREPLDFAMSETVLRKLPPETGGAIGVDASGSAFAVYNTKGMFTGLAESSGRMEVWHKETDLSIPIPQMSAPAKVMESFIGQFQSTGSMKVLFGEKDQRSFLGQPISFEQISKAPPSVFFRAGPAGTHPRPKREEPRPLHTLVMVGKRKSDHANTRLCWLVANIEGNCIETGQVWQAYGVINPVSLGSQQQQQPQQQQCHSADIHDFGFFLFLQDKPLKRLNSSVPLKSLACFDLRDFRTKHRLTPIMCDSTYCGIHGSSMLQTYLSDSDDSDNTGSAESDSDQETSSDDDR